MAKNSVRYVVNLENKPYMERIEIVKHMQLDSLCVLIRFDRPLVEFMATRSQVRKIKRGKGRLSITEKMIHSALYVR